MSLTLLASVCLLAGAVLADPDTLKWREEQDARLRRPDGWLSVAGLFWLKPGDNVLGTDPKSDVLLPKGSAPGIVGNLKMADKKVTIQVSPGVTVTANGESISAGELKTDASGSPTKVQVKDLMFTIIERGGRIGVRLWDPNTANRKNFKGRQWFPVDAKFNVEAKYTAYPEPKELPIVTILGDIEPAKNPGYVTFRWEGQEVRLEAQASGDGLFFNFREASSGKESYPAGRFLYTEAPKDGKVVLDFNRSVSPPCAFTDFATCPLPPPSNVLKVRIAAGERWTQKH